MSQSHFHTPADLELVPIKNSIRRRAEVGATPILDSIRMTAVETMGDGPVPITEIRPEKKSEARIRERAEAAREGRRLPGDRRRNLVFCAIFCVLMAAALWYFMLFSREYFADRPINGQSPDGTVAVLRAVGVSLAVSLPIGLLMGLSRIFYKKDTFLGLRFRGSRFLRRYIPTAVICYLGFFLLWTVIAQLAHVDREKSVMVYTTGVSVYLLVSLPAWWGIHYTLPQLETEK